MNTEEYIRVRVKTGAKVEKLHKAKNTFFIEVKEKPERNEANAKIKQLLSKEIGCNSKELSLIKGAKTSSKTYLLVNR